MVAAQTAAQTKQPEPISFYQKSNALYLARNYQTNRFWFWVTTREKNFLQRFLL
jgi:hypothetical protein